MRKPNQTAENKPNRGLVEVIKVTDAAHLQEVFRIREAVFVVEQGVKREDELDQFENESHHFLATHKSHGACGAARWRLTQHGVKLERFAVTSTARNKGIASALVEAVLKDIAADPKAGSMPLYLHAQIEAVALYEKYGFAKTGPTFLECDITHYKMTKEPF